MGLATTTVIMVSSGKGTENRIHIKDSASLETAHKINTVIFDKTGTLTHGKPEVTDIVATDGMKNEELLILAASIEKGSEHSLAEAIVKQSEKEKLILHKVEGFKAIAGHGIEGVIDKKKIYFGNKRL